MNDYDNIVPKNGLQDSYALENGLENGLEAITVESDDIDELCADCKIEVKTRYDVDNEGWKKTGTFYVDAFCNSCITYIEQRDFWKKIKENPNYKQYVEYYQHKWKWG